MSTRPRVTSKDLDRIVGELNQFFGKSKEAWTKQPDGRYRANVDTFVIDSANGGYRLAQIANDGGGERNLTGRGTAREVYRQIRALITGAKLERLGGSSQAVHLI